MKTKVVNLRREKYDVYIGRRGKGHDGYFGNPFPFFGKHSRADSIELFREYFLDRLAKDKVFARRVRELKGKTLGCFCSPLPCHGEVIAEYVNGLN